VKVGDWRLEKPSGGEPGGFLLLGLIENLKWVWYNGNRTKCCGQDLDHSRVPDISAYKGLGRNNSVYSLLGGWKGT
jgi:hypothetical protein